MNFTKSFFKLPFLLLVLVLFNFTSKAYLNPYGIDFTYDDDIAILLINEDTKTTILEKDKDKKFPCSALAKMMTTILVLEHPECVKNPKKFLSRKITATSQIFDRLYLKGASNANIRKGETITVKDALYATMLQSACETTMMLVEMLDKEDTEKFVSRMNEKAKELNMKNTYFVDPDGLDTTSQYTTAYDMYLLTKYCLKNNIFKAISTTPTYEIPPTNVHPNPTKLIHTNKMLNQFQGGRNYDNRVRGIKTAKIEGKEHLISIAKDKSYNYTLIILGAPRINNEQTIYTESKKLYDWAFKNLKLEVVGVPYEKTIPNNIKINMSKDSGGVILTPKEQATFLIPTSVDKSTIYWDISNLPKSLDAPISKGDYIGSVELKLSDQVIGEVSVIAARDVNVDILAFTSNMVIKTLTSWWFISLFILGIILFLWFFINNKFNPKKINKKNIKRYKPFK